MKCDFVIFDSEKNLQISQSQPKIAVIIPCYNEEQTIGTVIAQFKMALPDAEIWVCDNKSSDKTAETARKAGAFVIFESYRGKGNAIRRLFAEVNADIYVMVDGDETYDASAAPNLIQELVEKRLDMINAARSAVEDEAYRRGHKFGNKLLTGTVQLIFGSHFKDIMSGYRVFSRRFVRSFPALSEGFEIETELTVHALRQKMPISEMPTKYSARPEGSSSKLNTMRDGLRILRMISRLVRDEKPMEFFGGFSAIFFGVSAFLIFPIFMTFWETGLVPRFPTLIGTIGLSIVGGLSLVTGVILDAQSRMRVEIRRFAYLAESARTNQQYDQWGEKGLSPDQTFMDAKNDS